MSRETLLDDAIAKAKEAEDWQLVEWLRMARGGESAARWYTAKLGEARLDMSKLMAENAKLREELADAPKCETCEAMLDCDECLRADGSHKERRRLSADNAKLRELVTYALKHIIEFECEELDREKLRGKPCEDCADYGSSDCPKCMPRMFDVSGIEVDE